MGKDAARREAVEDVRKKIGDAAAVAVGAMRDELRTALLSARALAIEVQALRAECATAKAAPSELRVRVLDCEDRLQALGLRLRKFDAWSAFNPLELQTAINARVMQKHFDDEIRFRDAIYAGVCRRFDRLERLTWRERLRFALFGRLPFIPPDVQPTPTPAPEQQVVE